MTSLPKSMAQWVIVIVVAWLQGPSLKAAVSLADITQWSGVPEGPGVARAALVIDWRDGQLPEIYGYRWPTGEPRSGKEMLDALIGAGFGLSADDTTFVTTLSQGSRTRAYSDNGTPANYFDDSYWGYWTAGSNPYTGAWTESMVGAAMRPLVDGSWDGWAYGVYGTLPGSPVTVPEPGVGLLGASGLLVWRRRRR
jgi:MYXO-CTERM domain-containing protein